MFVIEIHGVYDVGVKNSMPILPAYNYRHK